MNRLSPDDRQAGTCARSWQKETSEARRMDRELKNQDVDPPGAQTHRKREGRPTTHQGSRTLPIHRFSSSISAVLSHPRAAPFSYPSSFIGPLSAPFPDLRVREA